MATCGRERENAAASSCARRWCRSIRCHQCRFSQRDSRSIHRVTHGLREPHSTRYSVPFARFPFCRSFYLRSAARSEERCLFASLGPLCAALAPYDCRLVLYQRHHLIVSVQPFTPWPCSLAYDDDVHCFEKTARRRKENSRSLDNVYTKTYTKTRQANNTLN